MHHGREREVARNTRWQKRLDSGCGSQLWQRERSAACSHPGGSKAKREGREQSQTVHFKAGRGDSLLPTKHQLPKTLHLTKHFQHF